MAYMSENTLALFHGFECIAVIWLWKILRKHHYKKGVVAKVGKSTGATAPFLCSEYSINLV